MNKLLFFIPFSVFQNSPIIFVNNYWILKNKLYLCLLSLKYSDYFITKR